MVPNNIENRQWRTLTAKQSEYRQKILAILTERVKKPMAQASLALVGTLDLIAVLGILVMVALIGRFHGIRNLRFLPKRWRFWLKRKGYQQWKFPRPGLDLIEKN